MKKAVVFTSSLLFAATMALAQDSPTAGSQDPSQNQATTTTQSQTSHGSTLRGCLSGSADNYTLTDLNGTQYKLIGGDSSLQGAVGHEVEVNGTQSQSAETSSGNGETMAHAANSFQVSQVRDTGSTCKMRSNSEANPNPHPMDEKTPKGESTSTVPQPQLMAMLQQSSAPMSSTGTDASQAAQSPTSPSSGQSAGGQTPPVTSQTPASSASPTSPDSQSGTSPANNTGMTPGEANSNAQAARPGETSTNPNTGQTTGQGVNGGAAPSTSPNAVPSSPNSTAPQSTGGTSANSSQPQSANDSNKPLYERQATDVPWAHHDSNTAPTSTNTPH